LLNPRQNKNSNYSEYLSLGAEITSAMLVPIVVGYLVDRNYQTEPWGFLTGMLVGFLGVFNIIYRIAKKSSRKNNNEK